MAVIVVAVDVAAIRALFETRTFGGALIALGSMLMAGLLTLGLPGLVRSVWSRRDDRPFLVGFEVAGWIALLVSAVEFLAFPMPIVALAEEILEIPLFFVGYDPANPDRFPWAFICFAAILFLSLPQLAMALAGERKTQKGQAFFRWDRMGVRSAGRR